MQAKYLSSVILSESEGACDRGRVEGPRGSFLYSYRIREFSRCPVARQVSGREFTRAVQVLK
jgi:hypothetical protein